jgi:hypothetical protein
VFGGNPDTGVQVMTVLPELQANVTVTNEEAP